MTRYDEFTLAIRTDSLFAVLKTHDKKSKRQRGNLPEDKDLANMKITLKELADGKNSTPERLKQLGQDLYKALFPDPIGLMFEDAVQTIRDARKQGKNDLLLRLVIDMEDPNSDINNWPLEFLRCPGRTSPEAGWWLGTDRNLIALSRRLELLEQETTEPEKKGIPLRVLVVVAAPAKHPGVLVGSVLRELAKLARDETTEQQGEPRMEVKVIGKLDDFEMQELGKLEVINKPATFVNVREQTEGCGWLPDVLHFIGHGSGHGMLGLVNTRNELDWCNADEFSQLCRALNLRLVLLQACETAKAETGSGFMSLAAYLVQQSIPAVVAMQFAIQNDYATQFAISFYQALKEGKDIDEAVQQGRWTLSNSIRWREPQFAAPVLFQYYPTGILVPYSGTGNTYNRSMSGAGALCDRPITLEQKPINFIERASDNIESAIKLIQENCISDANHVLNSALVNVQSARPKLVTRINIAIRMLQGGDDPEEVKAILSNIYKDLIGIVPNPTTNKTNDTTKVASGSDIDSIGFQSTTLAAVNTDMLQRRYQVKSEAEYTYSPIQKRRGASAKRGVSDDKST